jgi:hypothetical protein
MVGQEALRKDLEQVFSEFNRATDSMTSLEAQFLEVIGAAIRTVYNLPYTSIKHQPQQRACG